MSDQDVEYVPLEELGSQQDARTPEDVLGAHCPIKALGHSLVERANYFHFIDYRGQVQSFTARTLTSAAILGLFFGNTSYLEETAPNRSAGEKELYGDKAPWKSTRIAPLLMQACFVAGFFDPEAVRGPGVWPYGRVDEWPRADARVVVHVGDRVYLLEPGPDGLHWTAPRDAGLKLGDFVYVRAQAEDPPSGLIDADGKDIDEPAAALDDESAAELRRFLGVWRWEDAGKVGQEPIAQFLFFGHIGASCIPGLLPRRPTSFIKGPSGAGKSEALKLECRLSGNGVWLDNATQSGVRKRFDGLNPARPVYCNEFESRGGPEVQRLQEIYDLARYCYSVDEGHYARAGEGLSGIIVAIFAFAAINPPHLEQQDANRMLLLSLGKLNVDRDQVRAFEAALPGMTALGPALRRRMIDRWIDYPKCFGAFRQALIGVGYEPRPADTFGTLLACGWLLSFAGLPSTADCAEWAQSIQTSLLASAMEESTAAWQRCLNDLLTARIEIAKDKARLPAGKLVEDVFRDPTNLDLQVSLKSWGLARVLRVSRAEVLKAKAEGGRPPNQDVYLAVANEHQGLEEIFRGTPWRNGGWRAVLGQMPGAEKNHAASFGGAKRSKAILIPGRAVLPPDDDSEAAQYADDPANPPVFTKDPFVLKDQPR
jgi:hypothetical protein